MLELAFTEDRIVVTANVEDLKRLASAREVHPGVVLVLDGALLRDEQLAVVRDAIIAIEEELAAGRDMVNRVLRISASGDKVFLSVAKHANED